MNAPTKTTWSVHGLFILCAALILGAMTALTRGVLATERERARTEEKAAEQERVRLALWRMDAAAAAWIADEAQHPVSTEAKTEAPKAGVRLRFDAREDGSLLADDPDRVPALRQTLGLPPGDNAFPTLCAGVPELPGAWSSPQPVPPEPREKIATPRSRDNAYQELADSAELLNRGRAVKGAIEKSQAQFNINTNITGEWNALGEWSLVRASLPRPARIAGELFLLRHLQWQRPGGSALRSIHGVWLDENALKLLFLPEAADLFPGAKLEPAAVENDAFALASFPWRLVPATVPAAAAPPLPRAIALSLAAGWIAAVLALAAAWLLVSGLLRLSERRASFVSAVTHELRTPLTTFRLYSEMLESGAVKEERRGDYFRTLRGEAERLSHLVENVLAFSRIERGSARSVPGLHVSGDLVRPTAGRLENRLAEAGLELAADWESPGWRETVRADPAAVEHVLFNLIDNAAKYATGSRPPRVELSAARRGNVLEIHVADHGPGIAKAERRRIFRAFHKSAAAAAESRPGVGLGLALSRRLARSAGGDLALAPADAGTRFVLTLPVG